MKAVRITFWLQFILAIILGISFLVHAGDLVLITTVVLMMFCCIINLVLTVRRVFRHPSYEIFAYFVVDIALIFIYNEYVGGAFFLARHHEEFLK